MRRQRPLRVALVGPSPEHMGGTGVLIRMLLRRGPSAGIAARAVVTDTMPSFLPAALDRVRYLRTGLRFAAYLTRLIRDTPQVEVIHAFASAGINFLLEPLPAIIIGRLLGKRVILNYHTGQAERHLRRWSRLVRWAAAKADVFVVPSQYLHEIFLRAGMMTTVVPNFVEVPDDLTAEPAGPVIVNTRALEPLYDIPTTLRAFALVQGRYPDARLLLVARGSRERHYRVLAAELGLRGVEFVGGVSHDDIPRYLSQAALFLNSSRIDNQPLSILEAFACGVPVVTTAAGGITDIVQHGETGMLAPVGDDRALSEHACAVLGDERLAQRLVAGGRAALAAHRWEALRDQWLEVYGARRHEFGGAHHSIGEIWRKALRAGPAGILHRVLQIPYDRMERRAAGRHAAQPDVAPRPVEAGGTPLLGGLADIATTLEIAQARFPQACAAAISAADRAAAHHFTLFGSMEVDAGPRINWLRDPATGTVVPLRFWRDLGIHGSEVGNIRVLWELNRQQPLLDVARAYRLTGDPRYAEEALAQMRSWLEQNPHLMGPNWMSALEVALRAITWLWVRWLLQPSEALDSRADGEIIAALRRAGEYIERHLSYTFAPNTHLLGEPLGLLYLGATLPDLPQARRWFKLGRRLLIREVRQQVLADGVYFEHSTWYHRFATDMCLHAAVVCERAGQPLPPTTLARVQQMLECLAALGARAGTVIPMGDEDGGRLLPLAHLPAHDFRDTMALGAVLFGRGDFKPEGSAPAEAVVWLLGPRGLEAYDRLESAPVRGGCVTLPSAGLVIMQNGRDLQLAFDGGDAARDWSAHDHADALSVQLRSAEGPMLIDPGTFTYDGSREWREYFRSTAAHNTLVIDGRSQQQPNGLFGWRHRGSIRRRDCIVGPDFDMVEGAYRYAEGLVHTRRVFFVKSAYWIIQDSVTGTGTHDLDLWFHFPPCRAQIDATGRCVAHTAGGELVIALLGADAQAQIVEGATDPIQGWASDGFQRKTAAPALCYTLRASLPVGMITLVAPCADGEGPVITALPRIEGSPAGTAVAVQWPERCDRIVLPPTPELGEARRA
jgi:glycosyltransferase involved in cell wall biosynthesis